MTWQILLYGIAIGFLCVLAAYMIVTMIACLTKIFQLPYIVVTFKKKPPENWWHYHTKDCGTKYRGCSPDCPKDIYERTGEWRG